MTLSVWNCIPTLERVGTMNLAALQILDQREVSHPCALDSGNPCRNDDSGTCV